MKQLRGDQNRTENKEHEKKSFRHRYYRTRRGLNGAAFTSKWVRSLRHVQSDALSILTCVKDVHPDEIYNFAAQSFVAESFKQPALTAQVSALSVIHLLEAVRIVDKSIKFYQAGTSEMYGNTSDILKSECSEFYPRSPYAAAKLYAHFMTINYRESYGIFAVNGILFNHESPLRGYEFVTRKISDAAAKIACGMHDAVTLGNLDAKRDWGYAPEYMEGIRRMMQAEKPSDYVLATGSAYSVREFVVSAFRHAGTGIEFKGTGLDEVGVNIGAA